MHSFTFLSSFTSTNYYRENITRNVLFLVFRVICVFSCFSSTYEKKSKKRNSCSENYILIPNTLHSVANKKNECVSVYRKIYGNFHSKNYYISLLLLLILLLLLLFLRLIINIKYDSMVELKCFCFMISA